MPAVFVHGVPESAALWDLLVASLDRTDVVRLSPPGFGAPVPDGFEPDRASYAGWLVDELRAIGGPIDLVGHDWGAGHTVGALVTEPGLVRSWAIDVAGLFHPEYVWHDMAQAWRTPAVGEEAIASMMGATTEEKANLFVMLGMPEPTALEIAAANDETMGRCILALYRSAGPAELRPLWDSLDTLRQRPGLVLIPTDDHYIGPLEYSEAVAERAGAAVARLEGLGHWWMVQDPPGVATTLREFWATVPDA